MINGRAFTKGKRPRQEGDAYVIISRLFWRLGFKFLNNHVTAKEAIQIANKLKVIHQMLVFHIISNLTGGNLYEFCLS